MASSISNGSEVGGEATGRRMTGGSGRVRLKPKIGLLNGVMIIVGVIVGSGIFVSPTGVIMWAGSVGLSLIIWLLCGLFSLLGALSYAELGTSILKSGGDYAYIKEAFGDLPAFMFLWTALIITIPASNAVTALTFANYVLRPTYGYCEIGQTELRLVAAAILCLLVFVNCYSVKWGTVTQNVFTFSKVFALIIIIVSGVAWLGLGHLQNYENAFVGSKDKPAWIALSLYQGIFSFSGWSYLNFVTEELKEPYKNLPRAIYISLPAVTAIYVLTNVAYFAVLTADQVMDSTAVAVDFAEYILGGFAVLMPIFVALSTVGSLNGVLFTSSRMFFVGARDGLLPELIAMINVKLLTPMPSLLILGVLSLLMLTSTDVYGLINYVSFTESLMFGTAVAGLLYLRWKKPEMSRPIKLNLSIPIAFCLMCIFLLVLPFFTQPYEVAIGTVIVLSGIPVFFFHKYGLPRMLWIRLQWNHFTRFCQKLAYCVPEEAVAGSHE